MFQSEAFLKFCRKLLNSQTEARPFQAEERGRGNEILESGEPVARIGRESSSFAAQSRIPLSQHAQLLPEPLGILGFR